MSILLGRAGPLFAVICTVALLAALIAGARAMTHRPARTVAAASTAVPLSVDTASRGLGIRPGFLGLSIEYWALEHYAGKNPRAIDPVMVQLIRNLVPGQSALIRIGGVTTDRTWWPARGLKQPPGVNYTLSRSRLEVARALAQAVGGRLIMGIQFELDSKVEAAAETRAMLAVIGRGTIEGFELGNEPDLYATSPWYELNGKEYFGRGLGWGVQQYLSQFRSIAASMGDVPLAGPALWPNSWLDELSQQLSENPHMVVVTAHRYPLEGCASTRGRPDYPTIPHLLAPASSLGIAEFLQPYVGVAHAHHAQIRDGEINTVACGSGAGVANTFASALWALDTMFELANIGLDGVNLHPYPGAPGELFSVQRAGSRWLGSVAPEYYGLLMFAQAAPAGSRLLSVSASSAPRTLHAWATRARDGTLRVVLINEDASHPVTVTLGASRLNRPALLERLQAPGIQSASGVRIGGQSFAPRTSTGNLSGRPGKLTVRPRGGAYLVSLPAASAAMLILH